MKTLEGTQALARVTVSRTNCGSLGHLGRRRAMKLGKTVAAIAALLASASIARAQHPPVDHSKDAAWEALIDDAEKQGFKFDRQCFPNDPKFPPYCTLGLVSPAGNGKKIRLMEFLDAHENLEWRALCVESTITATRTCYDVETDEATEQMYDDEKKDWAILSTHRETAPLGQQQPPITSSIPQAPLASIPQTQSQTLKEWDVAFSNGNVMHRILLSGSNGTRQLLATQRNASGMITSSSTCNFTQTWSDCVTNDGTHYQLQPGTIAWLYGQIPCPSVSLCGH
jgi:hypothetical protein